MKAYQFDQPNQGRVIELDVPRAKDDEIVIQVKAAGICGTDIHIYEGNYYGEYPIIGGHELSGIVTEVGRNVSGYAVGDIVSADPNVFCEACYFCKQNLQNHCLDRAAIGIERMGGFAEYIAIPVSSAFKLEGKKTFEEYAFLEPLSCVINGQKRARGDIGQNVLVFGCGSIGLLQIQLARFNGAAKIVAVDIDESRAELACKMGANDFVLSDSIMTKRLFDLSPHGFQLVVDCTGVPKVLENAVQFVRDDGILHVFGVCNNDAKITVNPYEIFLREIKIIGSHSLRKTFADAINMVEDGLINTKDLIGERVHTDQMPDAIEAMRQGKSSLKTMLVYD